MSFLHIYSCQNPSNEHVNMCQTVRAHSVQRDVLQIQTVQVAWRIFISTFGCSWSFLKSSSVFEEYQAGLQSFWRFSRMWNNFKPCPSRPRCSMHSSGPRQLLLLWRSQLHRRLLMTCCLANSIILIRLCFWLQLPRILPDMWGSPASQMWMCSWYWLQGSVLL